MILHQFFRGIFSLWDGKWFETNLKVSLSKYKKNRWDDEKIPTTWWVKYNEEIVPYYNCIVLFRSITDKLFYNIFPQKKKTLNLIFWKPSKFSYIPLVESRVVYVYINI